ncbi:phosphohydrolase [Ruegeria lacuscaerulensis ITI-1157]|nr:phosphohydrolase [Ruegeria lacuscaerulensis ITI-1157]SHK04462.1 Oligoribonuclease NrnB or cAMP/cGMP phosphodiesterase, DHH superfamily [Ruegeria lacuscaerulensis ITI-1157]
MNRTICIYHANCADGFTAAWAVREALGNKVEYVPASYGDAPPEVTGADVIIVDFSYKRPMLERMAQTARSVLVLDHHKTAQADLAGIPAPEGQWDMHRSTAGNPVALFDMDRSGAQMAWDYFHQGARPFLVDVVADRDLWRWQLDQSREINAVIGSHEMTWDTWGDLAARLQADADIGRVAAEGKAILRAHDKLVRQVIDASKRRMVIGGYDVPVAAAPYALASDTAGAMAEGEPFAATYVDRPKGRAFSLRSRSNGIDVSEIAKAYGGGGHRSAAGFLMPLGWEGDTQPAQVKDAARVLLEADDYMPTVAKIAAVKAHTLREGKVRPVTVVEGWRAALRALAEQEQRDE